MIRALTLTRCSGKRSALELLRRNFVAQTATTAPNKLPLAEFLRDHRKRTETDGFVLRSPFKEVSIFDMTVDQYIWKNMAKWKNHVAIMCSVTGRKYTYSKLRDHCAALAIRMRTDLKLGQNDMVAVCMPNVPGERTTNIFLLQFFLSHSVSTISALDCVMSSFFCVKSVSGQCTRKIAQQNRVVRLGETKNLVQPQLAKSSDSLLTASAYFRPRVCYCRTRIR